MTNAKLDAMLPALKFTLPSAVAGGADVVISPPPSLSYMLDAGGGRDAKSIR